MDFLKRLGNYRVWRRARIIINQNFPDANNEELQRIAGEVCAVCRYSMRNAKKLPCGHFLHAHCLRAWTQAGQTCVCPVCRRPLLRNTGMTQFQAAARPAAQDARVAEPGAAVAPDAAMPENAGEILLENPGDLQPPAPFPLESPPAPMPAASPRVNRLLHFNSSNTPLLRWLPLPSFSFEVVRGADQEDLELQHQLALIAEFEAIERRRAEQQQQQNNRISIEEMPPLIPIIPVENNREAPENPQENPLPPPPAPPAEPEQLLENPFSGLQAQN